MNKSLLAVLAVCAFTVDQLVAQPTLTASAICPAVGDVINNVNGGYVSPGSPGANQTWDLSSMTSGTPAPMTFVTPASTPYASSFPAANVATGNSGSYAYYATSATVWQNAGQVSGSGVIMSYSDREDMLRFPCSYNSNYTDTWATTFTNGGTTFYRTGTTTVTADGYGTLITPAGTFNNVMRVHFYQDYQDSANLTGTPFTLYYTNDEYMWYLNGNHNPIAFVFDLDANGSPVQAGFYMTGVMGVEENSALVSYDVYPNPVSENLNISMVLKENKNVSIRLFNSIGAEVAASIDSEANFGENSYCFNVQNLPAGIYCAQVALDGKPASTRRFTVNR